MGRRSEQRIAISFPIVVRGLDSRGNPFAITTETCDISFSGASLKGLHEIVEPDMKVEVESHGRKVWYRVQWVGKAGASNANAGTIGVRCLEQGKYIWGIAPKEWEPDTYDLSTPAQQRTAPASAFEAFASWKGPERRQFARHLCRIETQVSSEGGSDGSPGKLTDISLGGCYVEMLSPPPVDTLVQLPFSLEGERLCLSGKVCSSQMGLGMGVSFTGMSPAVFEKLRRFAPPTAANSAQPSSPQRKVLPPHSHSRAHSVPEPDSIDLPAPADAVEAVVRLLLRKGLLTRAELSEELDKPHSVRT